jgi:hypothetical protein
MGRREVGWRWEGERWDGAGDLELFKVRRLWNVRITAAIELRGVCNVDTRGNMPLHFVHTQGATLIFYIE